jgi:hypothetical protein
MAALVSDTRISHADLKRLSRRIDTLMAHRRTTLFARGTVIGFQHGKKYVIAVAAYQNPTCTICCEIWPTPFSSRRNWNMRVTDVDIGLEKIRKAMPDVTFVVPPTSSLPDKPKKRKREDVAKSNKVRKSVAPWLADDGDLVMCKCNFYRDNYTSDDDVELEMVTWFNKMVELCPSCRCAFSIG